MIVVVEVKNIEKYYPKYQDRLLSWIKLYFRDSIDGRTKTLYKNFFNDPEVENLDEINRYRLLSLIAKQAELKRPVPLDEKRINEMGWNLKKCPISNTIRVLSEKFISVCCDSEKPAVQNRELRIENKELRIQNEVPDIFFEFYKIYPGTKSKTKNYQYLVKLYKDEVATILPKLKPALEKEIAHKDKLKQAGVFCSPWKNLETWIHKRCWEQELSNIEILPTKIKEVDEKFAI